MAGSLFAAFSGKAGVHDHAQAVVVHVIAIFELRLREQFAACLKKFRRMGDLIVLIGMQAHRENVGGDGIALRSCRDGKQQLLQVSAAEGIRRAAPTQEAEGRYWGFAERDGALQARRAFRADRDHCLKDRKPTGRAFRAQARHRGAFR